MQCKHCGGELKGNWCPKCGKTTSATSIGKSTVAKPGAQPTKVVPPRATNTSQDRFNSHLSGFGDRAKQELQHQKAVANSGPDWGGTRRTEKKNRTIELAATALLFISSIIMFVTFFLPYFQGYKAIDNNGVIEWDKELSNFSGVGSFSFGIGFWIILAFIFNIVLMLVTVARLLVVADKLKMFKILDKPLGSIIITGSGLAVAIFGFMLSISAGQFAKDTWTNGNEQLRIEDTIGSGINLLMVLGFITLGLAITVTIIRLITLTNIKVAIKPTKETAQANREAGNTVRTYKQNTFNRAQEVYQPQAIRTLADTAGPSQRQLREQMMQEQEAMNGLPQQVYDELGNPVFDELGNPVYATQEQYPQDLQVQGDMGGQFEQAPQDAYVEQPVEEQVLTPAEAARAKIAAQRAAKAAEQAAAQAQVAPVVAQPTQAPIEATQPTHAPVVEAQEASRFEGMSDTEVDQALAQARTATVAAEEAFVAHAADVHAQMAQQAVEAEPVKLTPAELAKQRLAEAKAKLEAAKNKNS